MAKPQHNPRMVASTRTRRRRIFGWTLAIIFVGSLVMPLTGYLLVAIQPAAAQQQSSTAAESQTNPRSNYWRAVREGYEGYTSASGPYTTNVLIQNGGQNWRQIRNGPIATYAPWFLAIVILTIGGFYLWRGPVRLKHPPSGETVERWTLPERVLHWYTASLFIILAITGLSLLFGRAALIPLIGLNAFSAYAEFAMTLHNYLGPFFVVGVLLELIAWFRFNIPNQTDIEWFKQGGGLVGDKHPDAGRSNGGEKIWFLLIATVGVAVCVTGLILDFPNFAQSRETMQLSNIIHNITAIIWVAVALGHIYLGTIGTEGALEGMTSGQVSVEWAKQHHNLWYEEVKRRGPGEARKPTGAAPRPASS